MIADAHKENVKDNLQDLVDALQSLQPIFRQICNLILQISP